MPQAKPQPAAPQSDSPDLDRVTPYGKWRKRVGISKATAKRLRDAGAGPRLTHISRRLIGVRERDHLEWLQSRSYGKSDNALKLAERQLAELAGAVRDGRVDREHAVRRLEQVARETGLTLETAA